MKLVLTRKNYDVSITISQRTEFSKYSIDYYGYGNKFTDIRRFDTIEEVIYFLENNDNFKWSVNKVKKEFNID